MNHAPTDFIEPAEPFRVLALDGGGIRGAFTAAFLAEVESISRKSIADHFDLITGTSTGGIIALALSVGRPAAEVLEFYQQDGPLIFPRLGVLDRWFKSLLAPKYDPAPLRSALTRVFGEAKLADCRTRVMVPSFNGASGEIRLYKTPHHPKILRDHAHSLVEVALATSAAPTFFPAAVRNGVPWIDGGVWANCPAALGALEAVFTLGIPARDVHILSVGTTEECFDLPRRRWAGGLVRWGPSIVSLFMRAQMSADLAQARLMLGDRLYRVNRVVPEGVFSMDDGRQISRLVGMGAEEALHHVELIASRFLGKPCVPWRAGPDASSAA